MRDMGKKLEKVIVLIGPFKELVGDVETRDALKIIIIII